MNYTLQRREVGDALVEMFTCGDCWYFAFVLSKELKRRGIWNRMVAVGSDWDSEPTGKLENLWWVHVMVRVESGLLLDITGAHTEADALKNWNSIIAIDFDAKNMKVLQANMGTGFVYEESRDYAPAAVNDLLEDLKLSG